MMKLTLKLIILATALLLICGCKRQRPPQVLEVKRVDPLVLDSAVPGAEAYRGAEPGQDFLVVTVDPGRELNSDAAVDEFARTLSLVDEDGRAQPSQGVEYKMVDGAGRLKLFFSVPEGENSFSLASGRERLAVNAPAVAESAGPAPPEAVPTDTRREISEVPGSVEVPGPVKGKPDYIPPGGSSPSIAEDEPPPPPKPTPPPTPRAPISGGVLNGKATSLPKPPYPAIAKAAHASGTVTVQVTIDESGKVISARAVSGHPLLQQAAVSAAYQARFTPTQLSGQPVKVTGVVTYNFVPE